MLGQEVNTEDAGSWAVASEVSCISRYVKSFIIQERCKLTFNKFTGNKAIPESKLRLVFIVYHYLTSNYNFTNIRLFVNLYVYIRVNLTWSNYNRQFPRFHQRSSSSAEKNYFATVVKLVNLTWLT